MNEFRAGPVFMAGLAFINHKIESESMAGRGHKLSFSVLIYRGMPSHLKNKLEVYE